MTRGCVALDPVPVLVAVEDELELTVEETLDVRILFLDEPIPWVMDERDRTRRN